MCIFALARTTYIPNNLQGGGCELLQNVYLCISTYNTLWYYRYGGSVVNCFKMCIFALARTTYLISHLSKSCCELLQNVYLCISTYNNEREIINTLYVVNCFKMCIFALARTTLIYAYSECISCELLQNVYLCISTYNPVGCIHTGLYVVNCFKMCIFALARTTYGFPCGAGNKL